MADPLTVLSAASSVISVLQLAVTLYNIVKGHSAAEFKLADLVADLEDLKLEISKLPREAQNELEESIVNEKLQRVKSFLAEITPQNRTRPSKSHLVKLSIDDSKLTRYIVDIKHCIDKVRHLENRHRLYVRISELVLICWVEDADKVRSNAIHNDLRRFTLPAPSLSYQSFEGGIGGHDEGYGQEIPPGYIQGVDDSIAAPSQQLNRRVTLPATPTSHLVWDAENASLYAEPEPIAGQDVIPAGEICEPLRDIRSTYDSGYDSLIPSVSNTPYFGGIYGQEQYQHRRGSSSVYSRSSIVSEASINEPISIKAKMYGSLTLTPIKLAYSYLGISMVRLTYLEGHRSVALVITLSGIYWAIMYLLNGSHTSVGIALRVITEADKRKLTRTQCLILARRSLIHHRMRLIVNLENQARSSISLTSHR
jgi:hypothetical protein